MFMEVEISYVCIHTTIKTKRSEFYRIDRLMMDVIPDQGT